MSVAVIPFPASSNVPTPRTLESALTALANEKKRADHLEQELAWKTRQIERLEHRLAERHQHEQWRRTLAEQPTKKLNATEKDVADDLYAVFRGRAHHGVDATKPIWPEGRAAKLGLSTDTYRGALKTLESTGGITRTQIIDKKTGNKRLVVAPTEQFWDAAAIARDDEQARNYDYRPRRCQQHPSATVTAIQETTRTRITRETIKRTYVCNDCGTVLDTESATTTVGDPEILGTTVERLAAMEETNRHVVGWPLSGVPKVLGTFKPPAGGRPLD